MKLKKIVLYPFRRAELLIADIFYNNVKLLFLKDDQQLYDLYWDWINSVNSWKKGETSYREVEVQHEILAAYTQGAMKDKEFDIGGSMKERIGGIHG